MATISGEAIATTISAAAHRTCRDYAELFRDEAKTAKTAAGNEASEWMYLARISELSLAWDIDDEIPLRGVDRLHDIPDEILRELADLARASKDPDLIARTCDLYWHRRQFQKRQRSDIDYVREAVQAYFDAALKLEDPDHWPSTTRRLQRGLGLARQLRMNDALTTGLRMTSEMLARHGGRDPLFLSHRLMVILLAAGEGDPAACIGYCDVAASAAEAAAESSRNPDALFRGRDYLELQMQWLQRSGTPERIQAVWERIARGYEAAAGYCVPDRHAVAAHFQERAVESLRRAHASKARVDDAHRRLLELQQIAVREMKPVTFSVDLSDMAKAAMARVEGLGCTDALAKLLTISRPPSLASYREWVAREETIANRLVPATLLNTDGKQVGARGPVTGGEDDATYSDIVARVRQSQISLARGAILPGLRVFWSEHVLSLEDIEVLIADSPLVAPERRATLARALHAGFREDWLLVAHILPPQLEHIVRSLFNAKGIIVSGLSDSIQHEFDLNRLLWMDDAEAVFGPDLLLDLRCSLIHAFGANIRNRMAHGLIDDRDFYSADVVYLWWLVLRVMITPTIRPQPVTPTATSNPTADIGAADPAASTNEPTDSRNT